MSEDDCDTGKDASDDKLVDDIEYKEEDSTVVVDDCGVSGVEFGDGEEGSRDKVGVDTADVFTIVKFGLLFIAVALGTSNVVNEKVLRVDAEIKKKKTNFIKRFPYSIKEIFQKLNRLRDFVCIYYRNKFNK